MNRWRSRNLRARLARTAASASLSAAGNTAPREVGRHTRQIRAAQLHLLFEQLPSALAGTTVVGLLVVFVLWGHVPQTWLIAWLLGNGLITLARAWLQRAWLQSAVADADIAPWVHRFLVGVLVSGLTWGIVCAFPVTAADVVERMFLVFTLAGLAAGGMSTLSSFRGAYATFLIPAILPFALKLLLEGGSVSVAMGAMLLLFIAMMALISERHYRSVTESLTLRFENAELLERLAAARDRQQAANRELEAQVEQKRQTEEALRRAYEDLEGKVQARTAELARTNDVLRTEKELFRITLASIGDAVITTDAAARITFLNSVAERLTGCSNDDAQGRLLGDILTIQDEGTREPAVDPVRECLHGADAITPGNHILLICAGQPERHIYLSAAAIRDGEAARIGVVLVFRDVTDERRLAQAISHQATHDTLTGLVNRHEFETRLGHLLASAHAHDPHALLYLDLDQFKVVNDTCGHAAGDELLRQVSGLLRTKLRARDTLARLGGDEFGVLLEHCSALEAERVANALRELVQGFRFGWQDKTFTIGVSIGLVPVAQPGETLAGMFRAADNACYAAKEGGRNRVHLHRPGDDLKAEREAEMSWVLRLRQAMAEERLVLHTQPIVPLAARAGSRAWQEILLRLVDERGTLVLPDAFLPTAMRYDLMRDLDRWVVENSLRALATLPPTAQDIGFTINLSAQSLGAADFLAFVTAQIAAHGVDAARLCFEITEATAISELHKALEFMQALKAHGCRFALDDFGTGLSSFSYLKTLPVDFLKIDGGFVRGMVDNDIDRAMIEAVHQLGHTMGVQTIAENVESAAHAAELARIGIDYGQGLALGAPRPLALA